MKRLLFFAAILLFCAAASPWRNNFGVTAGPRTFYIAPNGNDANSATQAQSQATPWKTLGPHTGSLAVGDIVAYQCGGTYFDSTDLRTSNVTLTSYGTGAQPNITGFYNVSTWTNLGNGVYESEAIPTNIIPNMVAINGKAYAMGRYPNPDAANKGYLSFESHSGTTSITDNQLSTTAINSTYVGAQVAMRVDHYGIAKGKITSVSGNTITYSNYSQGGGISLADNFGYFIQNDIKTLDQFGEWYYNQSTKKIDVYFGSAGPTGNTVQIGIRDKLLIPHASNVRVDGLTFSGANYCIYTDWSGLKNLTINNCNLLYAGYTLCGIANMQGINVTNTTMNWGLLNGFTVFAWDSIITVRNCSVSNITPYPGMVAIDPNTNNYGCAINTGTADSVMVENNDLHQIGYIGLRFNDGNNVYFRNNTCDTFQFCLDDSGALYCWGDPNNKKPLHDRYVLNNVFKHGIGTAAGIPAGEGLWGGGIYMDDRMKNVVIDGNTVDSTTYSGIYLHNAINMTITNNVFVNNTGAGIKAQHDKVITGAMTGWIVKKNKILANNTSQLFIDIRSNWNDFLSWFTTIDSNYYARLSNDNAAISTNYFGGSPSSFTLNGWKTFIGDEGHSVKTNIADISKVVFKTNYSKAVTKDYQVCTSCVGLDGSSIVNKFSIPSFSSNIIIKP